MAKKKKLKRVGRVRNREKAAKHSRQQTLTDADIAYLDAEIAEYERNHNINR